MRTQEKLPLQKIDEIIIRHSKKSGIDFFKKRKDTGNTLEELQENLETEITEKHPLTMMLFYKYCLSPVMKTIFSYDRKFVENQIDLMMILNMFNSYKKGIEKASKNYQNYKGNVDWQEKIPTMFNEDEFESIAEKLKELLVNLPETTKKMCHYLYENDTAVKNVLEGGARELIQALDNRVDQTTLKKHAENFLKDGITDEMCVLIRNQAFDRIGAGKLSPYSDFGIFLVTLERIFTYAEIIHYGKYANLAESGSNDPSKINFKKY